MGMRKGERYDHLEWCYIAQLIGVWSTDYAPQLNPFLNAS